MKNPFKPDGAVAAGVGVLESTNLYQLLVESVRDYAIFALDSEGRVATWNPGARKFKGYEAGDIIGQHFSVFYSADDIAAGKPAREIEIATRDGRVEDEGWRLRKDGSRFWANVVITALRRESGELVGFAKVTRDLTERRESELKAIRDAKRLAESEASNRAKGDFLAAMSHELRTPLNAIGGYAQLMAMGVHGPVTEQQTEDLDRINLSQRHLLGIINDILNFSKIEAGKLEYQVSEFELGPLVQQVVGMAIPLAQSKDIKLKPAECPEGVIAIADSQKTEQILMNLVTNAVTFTDAGGWLSIACGATDGRGWVKVADGGVGIPADKLDEIFDPFVQIGRSLTTSHQGTGLGLAISRDLARGMGGELNVVSVMGKGSEFVLWLPAGGEKRLTAESAESRRESRNNHDS